MAESIKPDKPYPDFPLFPHATGRWAKKIRGKLHYFGPWADSESALQRYLDEKDYLHAGRKPPEKRTGLTLRQLINDFQDAKRALADSDEITEATFKSYHLTCKRIAQYFGPDRLVEDLRPEDFSQFRRDLAKTNGLLGLRNQITHARMIFKYGYDSGLLDQPIRYGANFGRPGTKAIRRIRTRRMFEAAEIRRMLKHAGPQMKAMILLGVNCALGNKDVELLPQAALDLKTGWLRYPRQKTGSDRKIPLWPETLTAIKAAIKARPAPARSELNNRVFLTATGESWHKTTTRYLTEQFRAFLMACDEIELAAAKKRRRKPPTKLYRPRLGFYTFRHVFETVGGESRDQVAVDAIMGHERGDMAAHYREDISDDRLKSVVNTVHDWLYSGISRANEKQDMPLRIVGDNSVV